VPAAQRGASRRLTRTGLAGLLVSAASGLVALLRAFR
jgi:hypothetical protein